MKADEPNSDPVEFLGFGLSCGVLRVFPEAAKPRRTAAEQRAYLDRLVKPRAEETQLAPELDEVIVEAGRPGARESH